MTFNKQYTYYCMIFASCMCSLSSVEASLSSAVSPSLPYIKDDLQLPSTFPRSHTQTHHRQRRTSSDINRAMYSNDLGDLAFINPHQTSSTRSVSKSAQDMHKFQYLTSSQSQSINTRLYMSTPNKRRTQQQTTSRNRGANAANHNRRGHTFRTLEGGNKKIHRKGANTKRAPRWEREGDLLYAEVTKQLLDSDNSEGSSGSNEVLLSLADRKIESVQDVCDMLAPWTATDEELIKRANTKKKIAPPPKDEEDESNQQPTNNKLPPFLWGSLPIGPVLASRLHASHRSQPTSVQQSAFSILTAGLSKGNKKNTTTKRTNAIIASPTGTGKTLAYLLPLLCTSPGGQSGEGTGGVLIVTPTIELACQIQREVDVLWPPSDGDDGESSSCFVVGAVDDLNNNVEEKEEDDDDFIPPGRVILQSIQHSPLIAGTPKMLRMLYKEAGQIVHEYNDDDYTITREERKTAQELLTNLRAIVLDESDRLLRTEAVARETTERKQHKIAQLNTSHDTGSRVKKKRLVVARQTQTEFLLRDLPIPSLDDVQIICASATIGRTMRRQLMQILDKPSADAAATLITGDEDERVKSKDAERRKSVLLPGRLRHAYRVVKETEPASTREPLLDNMTKAERNDELRARDTMSALWDIMTSIEDAKPIIIFPGRVGVERVQRELTARGLSDVRTLRNLDGKSPEEMEGKELDSAVSIDKDQKWKSIPVYIIGERFARGLDLPDVEYVFMLSPPSSAAGYAHMAGRTGRVGREGTAITLVRPKNNEVQRLAAIAEALGLKFAESMCGGAGGGFDADQSIIIHDENKDTSHDQTKNDVDSKETITYPWALLSESQLRKKLNSELSDYLVSYGAPIGRRPKKADLLAAIQALHSKV